MTRTQHRWGRLFTLAVAAGSVCAAIAGLPAAATLRGPYRPGATRAPEASDDLPYAPVTPPPVTGIPAPCPADHEFPAGSPAKAVAGLEKNWDVVLTGTQAADPDYTPVVAAMWTTLDAIDCTPMPTRLVHNAGGRLRIVAEPIPGWNHGDWSLSNPGALTFDLSKMAETSRKGEDERVVRLIVHELSHIYSADRGDNRAYWRDFTALNQRYGAVSEYGAGSDSEAFSEAVGYFVARCAVEPGRSGNPYASSGDGRRELFAMVRDEVFGGRAFGPEPGQPVDCG